MAFNNAEQRHRLWDILCSSQHHVLLLTLRYCTRLQNPGKTLSSTVTLQADIWHLLPPTLPHTWNYVLRSTHTITFDLRNFIFCFKGWILTKDCHLWQCNHDSCTAQNCQKCLSLQRGKGYQDPNMEKIEKLKSCRPETKLKGFRQQGINVIPKKCANNQTSLQVLPYMKPGRPWLSWGEAKDIANYKPKTIKTSE